MKSYAPPLADEAPAILRFERTETATRPVRPYLPGVAVTGIGVFVLTHNRPHFLRRSIDSVYRVMGDDVEVTVIDNGSGPETRAVIDAETRLAGKILLPHNVLLCPAWLGAGVMLGSAYRYVLLLEDDMELRKHPEVAARLLDGLPSVGVVSLQDSPEHAAIEEFDCFGEHWKTKRLERGSALLLSPKHLLANVPATCNPLQFDHWLFSWAPLSILNLHLLAVVLQGGARHLGCNPGDSTWAAHGTPEFDDSEGAI